MANVYEGGIELHFAFSTTLAKPLSLSLSLSLPSSLSSSSSSTLDFEKMQEACSFWQMQTCPTFVHCWVEEKEEEEEEEDERKGGIYSSPFLPLPPSLHDFCRNDLSCSQSHLFSSSPHAQEFLFGRWKRRMRRRRKQRTECHAWDIRKWGGGGGWECEWEWKVGHMSCCAVHTVMWGILGREE